MFLILVALLALPFLEIAVMVQVAQWIGVLDMFGLLILVSIMGLVVVKHQGTGAWRRIRAELQMGRVPGAELVDGALVLLAGVLLVIPGFVTDAIGVLLLIPPVRHVVRVAASRRFRGRVAVATRPRVDASRHSAGDVIDVEGAARRAPARDYPELEPPSPN
jgi:UPF0716 protein FxsA